MSMTFEALVALLTPDADRKLSITGAQLQSAAITDLFTACFVDATLNLSDATAHVDEVAKTVTIDGEVAAKTFLSSVTATLSKGVFRLDGVSGEVMLTAPIAVGDKDWTPAVAYPMLADSIVAKPSYADPVLTLSSPPNQALPANFRANLGLSPDIKAVADNQVAGVSIAAKLGLPGTGVLADLAALNLPTGSIEGAVVTFTSPFGKDGAPTPYPQLWLETAAIGKEITINGYKLTFSVAAAAALQEIGDDETQVDDVAVVALGAAVLLAKFTPSGGKINPFQITAALTSDTTPLLIFRGSGLPTDKYKVDDLSALLADTSVKSTLSPSDATFAIIDGIELKQVVLSLSVADKKPDFRSLEIGVTLGRDKKWSAFGDFLTFKQIDVDISVNKVGGSYKPAAGVACQAYIAGNEKISLDASINYPDLEFSVKLDIEKEKEHLDITSTVDGLIGSGSTGLSTFTAEAFEVSGNITEGRYGFLAQITENWKLIGPLSLSSITLDLSYEKAAGENSATINGAIAASLTLASVPILVSANYASGDGWAFSGGTSPTASVSLTDLITDLARIFGFDPPAGLPQVMLKKFEVEYKYPSKEFSVSAEISFDSAAVNLADLPLVGRLAGADFSISLKTISFDASCKPGNNDDVCTLTLEVAIGQGDVKRLVIPLSKSKKERELSLDDALPLSVDTSEYPKDGDGVWIDIQRSFGPVSIDKIGFGLSSKGVSASLNASLSMKGLDIGVEGLGAVIPLQKPYTPTFKIDGLSLAYETPAVTIGGGMAKVGEDPLSFVGSLTVKTKTLSLMAFGGYTASSPPSLFAYAALNTPLGGPPVFFVTGLAAGFGVNTDLKLPEIDGVEKFPFVAWAMEGKAPKEISKVKEALTGAVVNRQGQYWLAAGVKFTSFEVVTSFALVTVQFGTEFQVALLGESTLSLPKGAEEPVLLAQMVLKAVYTPSQGVFSVAAQLTSASHVLDKDCRITGGFAFYLWFDPNAAAGQFVITLGGYNPNFKKPDYYPVVPRLGVDWQVSEALSIRGGLYTALTPSMIMAGGSLDAVWRSGDIKAWFSLYVDFIIQWAPFYYEIEAGVNFGVELTISILGASFTISIDAGATLFISGPPFSGTARIHLSVLTFEVAFGDSPEVPKLDWKGFKEQFLPSPTRNQDQSSGRAEAAGDSPVVKLVIVEGMLQDLRDQKDAQGAPFPVDFLVDPKQLALTAHTMIPVKKLSFNGADIPADWTTDLAVGPLDIPTFSSDLSLSIEYGEPGDESPYERAGADTKTRAGAPVALWGARAEAKDLKGRALVPGALQSIGVVPFLPTPGATQKVKIATLQQQISESFELKWSKDLAPHTDSFDQSTAMETLTKTINDPKIALIRSNIVACLLMSGIDVSPDINVAAMTDPERLGYLAPVTLSLLGEARTLQIGSQP
jgi:hypothetical protein